MNPCPHRRRAGHPARTCSGSRASVGFVLASAFRPQCSRDYESGATAPPPRPRRPNRQSCARRDGDLEAPLVQASRPWPGRGAVTLSAASRTSSARMADPQEERLEYEPGFVLVVPGCVPSSRSLCRSPHPGPAIRRALVQADQEQPPPSSIGEERSRARSERAVFLYEVVVPQDFAFGVPGRPRRPCQSAQTSCRRNGGGRGHVVQFVGVKLAAVDLAGPKHPAAPRSRAGVQAWSSVWWSR